MAKRVSMTFRVQVDWWVKPYLSAVALFAWLTTLQSDVDKILRRVMSGIRLVRSHG